jgi:hypothetical protein
VGDQQEDIINGTTVVTDSVGTADITTPSGGGCSGTILHPNWVLTAKHCTSTNGEIDGPPGAQNSMDARLLGGSKKKSVAIFRHPSLDVALVRLSSAPLSASGQKMTNRVYLGNVHSLEHRTLYTQGWGNNAITSCDPAAGTGWGTLRSANINISGVGTPYVIAVPTNGAIQWTADSGSSMYLSVNGFYRPISVLSTAKCTSAPLEVMFTRNVRIDLVRGWAQGIIGSAPTAGTVSGYERSDGTSAVVYPHYQTNRIHELALTSTGWGLYDLHSAANLNVTAASEVTAYVRSDGMDTVVFAGSDGHVRQLYRPAGWQSDDLSGAGVGVMAGHRPAGYVRSDEMNAVVYRGTDNHIHELSLTAGAPAWSNTDLSQAASLPSSPAGDPTGYVRADGTSSVVYRGLNGHVMELALLGTSWFAYDLSNASGATANARLPLSTPRPYTRPDGVSAIVYVNTSHQIEELALINGLWTATNLLATTGTTTNTVTPFVRGDGLAALAYVNSDGKVYEAKLDGNWIVTDMNALGAPAASIPAGGLASINGYVRSDKVTSIVYQTPTHHVIELALVNGVYTPYDLTNTVNGAI